MRRFARLSALVFVLFAFAVSADFNRASAQTPTPTPIQAGQVIISEFRLRGPAGAEDEFVELYNNTDSPITVQALDASSGWSVAFSDGNITGALFTIPNGTILPARSHYLGGNANGYSLCNYPSGNNPSPTTAPVPSVVASPCVTNGIGGTFTHTTPDTTWSFDVAEGSGLALFATTNLPNFTASTRLDAVGFTSSPALYKEGGGIPNTVTASIEHTYYRDLRNGLPRDTGDNAADFLLVGTSINIQVTRLGAPGPENSRSPVVNNATINVALLDSTQSSSSPPNRVRSFTTEDPNTSLFGTLSIRRRVTNNTGLPVSRLRFRVINLTTDGTPGSECEGGTCATLRVLPSDDGTQGGVLDPATCAAESGSPSPPCIVTLKGLTREEPPEQPAGGGYNTSLSADSVTLSTPLAAGKSINVVFKLGVQRTGPFRFFVNFEAQNGSAPISLGPAGSGTDLSKDINKKRVVADSARPAPGAAVPARPAAAPGAAPVNVYAPFFINLTPTRAEEEEKEDEGKEKKSDETPPAAEPAPQTPEAPPAASAPAADEAAPQPAPADTQRAPQKQLPAAAKASKRGEQ